MNAEELIERLKKSFSAPSKKDERIKVVLMCIVISTTFWFFNALNQDNYTSQIDYPITWDYDASRFIAVTEMPKSIPIEVNGGGWDLMTRSFGFNMNPMNIALNEPDNSTYMLTSQLRAELSRNLDPVGINFLIQDSLKYDIQPRVERRLLLMFDPTGVQLDADYRLSGSFRLNPDSITVEGPERIVHELPADLMIKASIEGVDGDFKGEISLPALPEFVQAKREKVTLSFEVMQYLKMTESKTVQLVNFPDDTWQTNPEVVQVEYELGEAVFDATDTSRISVIADYNRWNPQDSTLLLEVIQRESLIENITLSSPTVKVIKK